MTEYDPAFPKPEKKHSAKCLCDACIAWRRGEGVKADQHPRGCGCPACVGRRNRRNGRARQQRVAKKLGTVGPHEEQWRHPLFRVEVKSGGQVPKKVLDAFAQSERARATGDGRPCMTVWVPANSSRPIAVLALDDLNAALDNQGPENAFAVREVLRTIARLAKEGEGLAR